MTTSQIKSESSANEKPKADEPVTLAPGAAVALRDAANKVADRILERRKARESSSVSESKR